MNTPYPTRATLIADCIEITDSAGVFRAPIMPKYPTEEMAHRIWATGESLKNE